MTLDGPCPNCDSGTDARAFVAYDPDPNGAQKETEWADDLPDLVGVACADCGFVLGVIDPRDLEDVDESEGSAGTDRFRVDEDLR